MDFKSLIAHDYGLSEQEFCHILGTFPLVEQPVKDAALVAYQEFALAPDDLAIKELIDTGETATVEFKVAACWNAFEGKKKDDMRQRTHAQAHQVQHGQTGSR